MKYVETICPVCENYITIPGKEILLASAMRHKTGGLPVVGCPLCARALVIKDAPETGMSAWIADIAEDPDWLGCIPLLDPEQAKIPTGYIGDLAYRRYRAGAGGEPLPRREYMMTYGIDPEIHILLNPGMFKTPFKV